MDDDGKTSRWIDDDRLHIHLLFVSCQDLAQTKLRVDIGIQHLYSYELYNQQKRLFCCHLVCYRKCQMQSTHRFPLGLKSSGQRKLYTIFLSQSLEFYTLLWIFLHQAWEKWKWHPLIFISGQNPLAASNTASSKSKWINVSSKFIATSIKCLNKFL